MRASTDAGLLHDQLASAAQRTFSGTEIMVHLTQTGTERPYQGTLEAEIVSIAGEAMANARSHSGCRTVWIICDYGPGELRVGVRDDGRGFDPAQATPAGHWGLIGMRERAVSVGARLTVTSAPGAGTEVAFVLPGIPAGRCYGAGSCGRAGVVALAHHNRGPAGFPTRPTSFGRCGVLGDALSSPGMNASTKVRILAVDDHALIRRGLSAFLGTEAGMEVVAEASNGEEAIERYREFRPDIVLMDLSMPVMDGLAATRAILDESPDARIIVLTTYDGDENIHRALEAGARGYLLKDMLVSEMTKVIRAVSQGRKSVKLKRLKSRTIKVNPGPPTELADVLRGRYVIERELGRGGMATVNLAHDLRHDRDVALKVLRPELAAVLGRERFLTEIRLTAQLDHPHILTLIESGESGGFLWYVIPYVRGESLRDRLNRHRQLSVDEALAIIKQIGGALDYAHQHDIIHRDIKPENILFHEGEAMLADFGIALGIKEAAGTG